MSGADTPRRRDPAELPMSDTRRVTDDVRGEIEFHIEERAAELVARGMPRERAVAEARELFGDRERIEAECRTIETRRRHVEGRAIRWRALQQDLVIGMRLLRKAPLVSIAAILTLALGIGANAAVFSLVNQTLLQPLAYPDANRLTTIAERHEKGWGNIPWPTFVDLSRDARSFSAMAAHGAGMTTVLGTSQPVRVQAASVSEQFFKTMGVSVERGRLPSADEHRLGGPPVVVVSHAFWQDRLGAPASLKGLKLKIDDSYDVIGVMPAGFGFPDDAQLWMPLEREAQGTSRTAHNWEVIGRLAPSVAAVSAQGELDRIMAGLRRQHFPDFDAVGSVVTPLQEQLTAKLDTPLMLLFAASGVLLLAACTNVASSQLARGTARVSELAVRSALGADRTRLVRQLLTEGALLATLGAIAGLALAWALLRVFTTVAPPELHIERVHIDGMVIGFAIVVALVTSLLFGLYPAMRLTESGTNIALRQGGRGTAGKGGARVWNLLVAAEIALAVTLLAGSAVLIRSFGKVMDVDLGFDPTNVAIAQIELPTVNYASAGASIPQFHERVVGGLRATPGVSLAGFANRLPLESSNPSGSLEVEGKPLSALGPFNSYAVYRVVGGDYFGALGIRVVQGRVFNGADDAGAPRVVVVNEEFARAEWPGVNPIGRRLRPYGMESAADEWFTVIGVVANSRTDGITSPYRNTYYFDHRQRPANRTRSVSYVMRSSLEATAATVALRRAIGTVDAQVPIEGGTMGRIVARTVADRRFMVLLLGAFAAMALTLALVGIYSVVSYTVAQRTREIGVRLALGASPQQVLRLVVGTAMHGILAGLLAGGMLALVGGRALRSLLYGVSPQDPVALFSAIALLGLVGVVSSALPARRATRVDPLIAMRAE